MRRDSFMKKTEKIIAAVLMMVIGVLLVIMKDNFIGILMTVAGLSLIVLGVADILHRFVPPAVVKIVVGIFVIVCGWLFVEAVLYIVSAILLIFGILLLYDRIKNRVCHASIWYEILEFAVPSICIAIGILLLFHRASIVDFIFILSGILTLVEGGLVLFCALSED